MWYIWFSHRCRHTYQCHSFGVRDDSTVVCLVRVRDPSADWSWRRFGRDDLSQAVSSRWAHKTVHWTQKGGNWMIHYRRSFSHKHRDSPVKSPIHLDGQTAWRGSEEGLAEGVWVRTKKVQLYIIQKITMNNRSLSCSWDYIRVQFVWEMLFREGEHEDARGNILDGAALLS